MKKIIHIKGMHCISCEMVLEKDLKNLKGVELIMLSHKKGIMEVDFSDESKFQEVQAIIENNGFQVIVEGEKTKLSLETILINIIIYLAIAVSFYGLSFIDLYRFIPDTSTLSFGSAFLVGIIASISTCLAITGGIIIGFSRYIDHAKGLAGHLKVQGAFQIGRILGFFLLGGVLGYIGQMFQMNFGITGIFTFIIGFLLVYMGLNILGIIPNMTKVGIHMPKSFTSKIESLGEPKYAPIVGALTFFIPCGFTQTMQLLAVSSGSFMLGGMVMAIFALGTFPVLFSVGLGSSYFKGKKFSFLNKLIGAIVIFFGIFTISNSYNLLSIASPSKTTQVIAEDQGSDTLVVNNSGETIRIAHNGYSTEPRIVKLKAGGNYTIVVTPTSNGLGCMGTQVIPKLSKTVSYVKKGLPITYEMKDAKKGNYDIVCASMGMEQGMIIVE